MMRYWLPKLVKVNGDEFTYVWLWWSFTIRNEQVKRFHAAGHVRFRVYRNGEHTNTIFYPVNYTPQYVREILKRHYQMNDNERIFVVKEGVTFT
jgi:hypothetical protein